MADNKEDKTIDIDINVDEEPVELGYQGNNDSPRETSADELKQQAGELFKAAGGLAGSFGKLAMKKGSELKDKIGDEEFQAKAKESVKSFKAKATEQASKVAEKATEMAENATKSIEEKTGAKITEAAPSEEAPKQVKTEPVSVETKTTNVPKEVKTEVKKPSVQKSTEPPKKSKGLIIALIIGLAVLGIAAVLFGGNKEEAAPEEPVAEETVEDTTEPEETDVAEETIDTSEQSEEQEEEILTIENSSDLQDLLTSDDEEDFTAFAGKYAGKTIEFDCSIDFLENHENYNTRYDFLLSSGDYSEEGQDGPTFKLENYNVSNEAFPDDSYAVGDSIHMVAKVEGFKNGVFYLTPIKVTHR